MPAISTAESRSTPQGGFGFGDFTAAFPAAGAAMDAFNAASSSAALPYRSFTGTLRALRSTDCTFPGRACSWGRSHCIRSPFIRSMAVGGSTPVMA